MNKKIIVVGLLCIAFQVRAAASADARLKQEVFLSSDQKDVAVFRQLLDLAVQKGRPSFFCIKYDGDRVVLHGYVEGGDKALLKTYKKGSLVDIIFKGLFSKPGEFVEARLLVERGDEVASMIQEITKTN